MGVSSYTAHRNKEVFGKDAKDFRPERWLEASEEQVRVMERSMLHFGAGNHLCLGKNISAREMYKVVPCLLRSFKVSFIFFLFFLSFLSVFNSTPPGGGDFLVSYAMYFRKVLSLPRLT